MLTNNINYQRIKKIKLSSSSSSSGRALCWNRLHVAKHNKEHLSFSSYTHNFDSTHLYIALILHKLGNWCCLKTDYPVLEMFFLFFIYICTTFNIPLHVINISMYACKEYELKDWNHTCSLYKCMSGYLCHQKDKEECILAQN